MNHALRLESTGQAPTRNAILYTATCSCGHWTVHNVVPVAARAAHASHASGAQTFDGEPDPSSWVPCASCGHDMYVHQHVGYGGCMYGEGCKCAEFKAA